MTIASKVSGKQYMSLFSVSYRTALRYMKTDRKELNVKFLTLADIKKLYRLSIQDFKEILDMEKCQNMTK